MVGCVIVRDGEVAGSGYHERVGGPHAEVNAIASLASPDLTGATVYVTLEPCSHEGRTPPCVDLLLKHRPARVVVAMEDPNPVVAGEGIRRLREAGVVVDVGVLEEEARALNEVYLKYITTGRPFVIAKCAMTLDGKIATHAGHSQWVTGEAARRKVHEMRNEVDAIMVGSRTLMLDNPSLTTRLDIPDTRDPVRVILDADEYLDENRKVFTLDSDAPTWVAVCHDREYPFAAQTIHVPAGGCGVDMSAVMVELGRREIASLLIEGGGTTLASAFEAGIVDVVRFFVAPKIIGGHGAITPVEGAGAATMDEAVQLECMQATPVGEDLLIEARVRR